MRLRFWRRAHDYDPLVCREFVELVTDYFEGALPDGERVRFEAHLAACHGCTGYLEDMRMLVNSLHALPAPPADPHTHDALLRAFRDLRGEA
jgi:anti-sigma factor RsiW